MTCNPHTFGRWVKGRRTGQYFRFCLCGASERSVQPPEGMETGPILKYSPPIGSEFQDFKPGYNRPMQAFNRFSVAGRVKRNILDHRQGAPDWREKAAGER
jgi:hypothetical protein